MIKYYAKQVNPEYQEDDLFFVRYDKDNKHSQLCWNDELYENDVVIEGNDEYRSYHTQAYEKVERIDSILYEYELTSNPKTNGCYWKNVSELINYYLTKECEGDKKYSPKEIHKWKELLDKWNGDEEDEIKALNLITGKEWHRATIRGYMQREWQYLLVSENITNKDIEYIGMCYFNTGMEYSIFETKEEFDNEESSYHIYCEDTNDLMDKLGCSKEEIEIYNFTGYQKIPTYEKV